MRGPLFLVALIAATIAGLAPSKAGDDLAGVWSGGGMVNLASGAQERTRCRANYQRVSGVKYNVTATCATTSGKFSESAEVQRVSGDRFTGRFHNAKHNISGSISIQLNSVGQIVHLVSPGGTATLQLQKR